MMGIFKKFFFTQIPNIITHYLHMLDTKNALPPGRAPDLCGHTAEARNNF